MIIGGGDNVAGLLLLINCPVVSQEVSDPLYRFAALFIGPLPSEFGLLFHLTECNISGNTVTGWFYCCVILHVVILFDYCVVIINRSHPN